ncbi:class I SAM-dependent DNA methyltransferase [Actinacidiphila yeochonensis]|uniref:class I SAM-dependent DNA methyltransferase n=1 Tax=Actinacidiphila yeochonensis TaxID=89050 RepID=UPI00055B8417|nr:class I SAM-dependent methyltransferase [Actinacidiphila yeochonensis]
MTEPDFLRATRASYDAMAADYAERFRAELVAKPLDRAVLAGFAELVRAGGGGPVADIGCGTGRVTAYLDAQGLPVFGIDLSPGMLAQARQTYPGLRFVEGSMLALDLPDASLAGILAWYSVIHVPPAHLPAVFAEFHRTLEPGGYLQLGFQLGDEVAHRTDGFGHPVDLHFHRLRPDVLSRLLADAGLVEYARTTRRRDDEEPFPEKTPQGFLLARKPLAAT